MNLPGFEGFTDISNSRWEELRLANNAKYPKSNIAKFGGNSKATLGTGHNFRSDVGRHRPRLVKILTLIGEKAPTDVSFNHVQPKTPMNHELSFIGQDDSKEKESRSRRSQNGSS